MAYEFINDTGVIVADTSVLEAEIQAEYQAVFGADLDLDPETPEGLLITAETTSRAGIATNNAQLANQINPNIAGGVFLDALWALTGGTRDVASASTFLVPPDVTGTAGTFIPAGSIAETPAGDQFQTLGGITLDGAGQGAVAFGSVEKGPIVAAIGDLNSIVTSVLGWETVNNTVAATLGTDTQSDISARAERITTLGVQGSGLAVAIFGQVGAVEGVTSLTFRENFTDVAITPTPPDNIDLAPHSVWACVSGGFDVDVATALLAAKSAGSNWNNGNSSTPISEVIVDPISNQPYSVLFDRPDAIPVTYEVTVAPSSVSNVVSLIKAAVVAYANGEIDGQPGLVVGADASPFEAAAAVNSVEPQLLVTNVRVSKVSPLDLQPATVEIEIFEQATVDESSVTVIVA